MACSDVEGTKAAFNAAYEAKDVDAIAELYEEECIYITQEDGMMRGRDRIRESMKKFLELFDKIEWGAEEGDTVTSGNLCVEAGYMKLKKIDTEDDWVHGLYVTTFVKGDDEKWRIKFDTGFQL